VFDDAAVMNSSGLSDGELWKFKFKKPYNSTHRDCRLLLLLLLLLLIAQTSSSSSKHIDPVTVSSFVGGLTGFDAKLTDEVAAVRQFAAASANARQLQAGFAEPAPGANLCVPRSQNFTVSTTAEADAAAAAVRCNGGRFNVYVKGHVMVNNTFSLPTGNTLYMFADGADAVMDGGGSVQLIKGAPGSYISLTGLRLQGGFSLSGGGAVGSPAGRVDAKGCTFFNNSALAGNTTVYLHLQQVLLRMNTCTDYDTVYCCCVLAFFLRGGRSCRGAGCCCQQLLVHSEHSVPVGGRAERFCCARAELQHFHQQHCWHLYWWGTRPWHRRRSACARLRLES
jgi:hypothetical protein